MLAIAVFFIMLALILYSLAIWSEKIKQGLQPWMVKTFSLAFLCDLLGTSLMFWRATVKFQLNIHSLCGYLALIIMGLHLIWGISALNKHGRTEKYFHRFSIYAWLIWLIAFISGLPRMS